MEVDHIKEKCRHEQCTCEVEAGHPYCSEHCRNAVEFTDEVPRDEAERGGCGCGDKDWSAK
jgi:hypothetical protein